MGKEVKNLARAAVIAALYAALTHLQNFLLPGSASWAVQLRFSEVLCVLAFFTPAAIPGLTLGCLVFNLTGGAGLPLDFLIGSLATYLAAQGMWLTRKWTPGGTPWLGLLLPAVTNAVLVGWELSVYIGGAFGINAAYVAAGEAIVLLIPGALLYHILRRRHLDESVFT